MYDKTFNAWESTTKECVSASRGTKESLHYSENWEQSMDESIYSQSGREPSIKKNTPSVPETWWYKL
jgi:hypothetical protein